MPGQNDVWIPVTNTPDTPVLIDLFDEAAPARRSATKPLIAGLTAVVLLLTGGAVVYAAQILWSL